MGGGQLSKCSSGLPSSRSSPCVLLDGMHPGEAVDAAPEAALRHVAVHDLADAPASFRASTMATLQVAPPGPPQLVADPSHLSSLVERHTTRGALTPVPSRAPAHSRRLTRRFGAAATRDLSLAQDGGDEEGDTRVVPSAMRAAPARLRAVPPFPTHESRSQDSLRSGTPSPNRASSVPYKSSLSD